VSAATVTASHPVLKCDGSKVFCQSLSDRLGDGHSKGLNYLDILNFRTGEHLDPIISYKVAANDKGVVINFCPFCGSEINMRYRKDDAPVCGQPEVHERHQ
jgi:exosome complex RNA-binding protein Csl4